MFPVVAEPTLQGAAVIMGLPFSGSIVLIMLIPHKALPLETALADSYQDGLHPGLGSRTNRTPGAG